MAHRNTLSVAVIDDNRLIRESLAAMLDATPGITAVASAVADASFLAQALPDVLLLDIGLHDDDSLGVAAALVERAPDARIIVMDVVPVSEEIAAFVSVGVSGFVSKDATFGELLATIRGVASGETVVPASVADTLLARIAAQAALAGRGAAAEDVRLTPREGEVIALITEGLSNKEIAERLGVASHTVKSHVRNVMEKLALHTRLQLAAFSRRDDAR
ncbi:MAG: response regulator transcription factor [Gemmatimonadaceae bacterium]